VIRLTAAQTQALGVLRDRCDLWTLTSNTNGPTYVASGSARILADLGLAEQQEIRGTWKYRITDAGIRLIDSQEVAP
jgi:hypothetical protein